MKNVMLTASPRYISVLPDKSAVRGIVVMVHFFELVLSQFL